MKRAYLLLNLGTPDDAGPEAVGRYLHEFLMDPRVIDVPRPLRWALVHWLIVPKRKHASSDLYKTIWNSRGSPLLFHLEDLAAGVRKLIPEQVEIAMRYGSPSITSVFEMFTRDGVEELTVLPLYPQYALSSTESAIDGCKEASEKTGFRGQIRYVGAFYDRPEFLRPLIESVREVMESRRPDHLLLSFHGLPASHVRKTYRGSTPNCLAAPGCCNRIIEANRDCYRAQSFATAREIARGSGIAAGEFTVSFQSRLGRSQWILPETEATIRMLAARGIRRLAVACPSFVADCLETLEEIGVRAMRVFREAGGESLIRIDCLNSNQQWTDGVARLLTTTAMPSDGSNKSPSRS